MTKRDRTPTFNMKVVTQETGLKPDTLRAWERRYGLPTPQRTGGGHRLYSQHDIDLLKWLIARQDEGMSISNAVDLWAQIEARGEDPFQTIPTATVYEPPSQPVSGDRTDTLRTDWIQACLKFDEYRAQHILAEAFAIFPVETVCFELLQRGLTQIGRGWYDGSISVQQEHFASSIALRQLDALLTATPSAATNRGRLLVACPPKEEHTFSPLLLTLMLRRRNWDVVYLGADVPLERLEHSVQAISPDLVVLVAQTLYTAGTMLPMADRLQQNRILLGFGGAVFSHLEDTRHHIPGYFLGTDLQSTPEIVNELVLSPPSQPETKRASADYQQTLAQYRKYRSAIEAYVHQSAGLEDLSPSELSNANEDLGNNISAALALGSMDLLEANIDWVQGLLINYHYRMPAEATATYVNAYHEAIKIHLPEQAQPLLDWFEELTSSPDFLKRIAKGG